MPTNPNMVAIQTVTVGAGGASSITFSNIPQTYTDLKVVVSARNIASNVAGGVWLYPNGSSANMTGRILAGTGSAAVSGTDTKVYGYTNSANSTASTFGNIEFYIPNYTSSNNKSISVDSVMENNATEGRQGLMAGLWSSSSAITSITLESFNNSTSAVSDFAQYSTATLYGVTSAGYGAKATGGIISQDANYFYHTFLASGTFTPTQSITADCLVVAGGGGGGSNAGGGGGAGGLLGFTSQSLTATNYTITVGAGGTGANNDSSLRGGTGSDSQFGSLTLVKGGGGGGSFVVASPYTNSNGGDGGSGGGAIGRAGLRSGGTATSGQGNNGGSGNSDESTYRSAGGGGGAGAAGQSGANSNTTPYAGAGGNGVSTYSSWGLATTTGQNISGTVWYAGGGGGADGANLGAGGNGGGTAGKTGNTNNDASSNTGGGGGALSQTVSGARGGNGGSGIVIVRYAK